MYNSMMNTNNPVYAKTIQDMILSKKTTVSSENWMWCERLNGTYLDCPISDNQQSNLMITVHNPSMVDQKYFKIKVSHGNYVVKIFDTTR